MAGINVCMTTVKLFDTLKTYCCVNGVKLGVFELENRIIHLFGYRNENSLFFLNSGNENANLLKWKEFFFCILI